MCNAAYSTTQRVHLSRGLGANTEGGRLAQSVQQAFDIPCTAFVAIADNRDVQQRRVWRCSSQPQHQILGLDAVQADAVGEQREREDTG